MSDLRSELYEKYVSTFKGEQTSFNQRSYWRWCDFRLKPWIFDLQPDASVLEIGCGPGYMLGYLSSLGYRNVQGIDVSAEQVELATTAGYNAQVLDVFVALDGALGKYDLILAFDFLEHFTREELGRLVCSLSRALKPGGRFIAQTPNGEGFHSTQIIYGDLTHCTILTPGAFRQLFRLGGFQQFEFKETGPVPKNVVGLIRTVLWRITRILLNLVRRIETGKVQAIWTENMLCQCRRPPA